MNPVVSPAEWVSARKHLLEQEKRVTQARDRVDRDRRSLPWVKVEKNYMFETPEGKRSLAELFDGRRQLVVQHFMFGPGWKEGCRGCSFKADHVDGALVHLWAHDINFVAISRAPLLEIAPFHKRMGWRFPWVSSHECDFNFDFHVSFTPAEAAAGKVYYNYAEQPYSGDELPGNSFFYKDAAGSVYHTYSIFGRGDEMLCSAYMYLDLTPNGREENGPHFNLFDWVQYHDRYEAPAKPACGCGEGA